MDWAQTDEPVNTGASKSDSAEISGASRTGTRPGGRSARIRHEVLSATLRLLEYSSVAELSVKQIADAAGTAETTIYRRWGSLARVLTEALSELMLAKNPLPDTGTLEGDLTQLLQNVVGLIESPMIRRVFRFSISIDDNDVEMDRARADFWRNRIAMGTTLVHRAIARGEIPPSEDPQIVIETLSGVVYVRAFLLGRPVTPQDIAASVSAAIHVAGAEG